MPKYRIIRPFYDGERLHPVDAELFFAEGAAPKGAVPLDAPRAPKPAADEADDFDTPPADITDAASGSTLSGLAKRGK